MPYTARLSPPPSALPASGGSPENQNKLEPRLGHQPLARATGRSRETSVRVALRGWPLANHPATPHRERTTLSDRWRRRLVVGHLECEPAHLPTRGLLVPFRSVRRPGSTFGWTTASLDISFETQGHQGRAVDRCVGHSLANQGVRRATLSAPRKWRATSASARGQRRYSETPRSDWRSPSDGVTPAVRISICEIIPPTVPADTG